MPATSDSKKRRRRIATDGPAMPLFMTASRSRVTERVAMSAPVCSEMQSYLRWAVEVSRFSPEEVQVMMLDRALTDYLKRDRAWQAEKVRRAGEEREPVVAGSFSPPGSAQGSDSGGRVAQSAQDSGAASWRRESSSEKAK
jgi:hypothetical protein